MAGCRQERPVPEEQEATVAGPDHHFHRVGRGGAGSAETRRVVSI